MLRVFPGQLKTETWESEGLGLCLVLSAAGEVMTAGSLLRLKAQGWPVTPQRERADSYVLAEYGDSELVGLITAEPAR